MAVSQKILKELPFDPRILHLGIHIHIYAKELKEKFERNIYTPVVIAGLFAITRR